jgi:hypothetical protein
MGISRTSGFGLAEILVVVAIVSLVGLGVASLTNHMMGSQNAAKFRADADNFTEEVRALLSSQQACTNSFAGRSSVPGASYNISTLYDGATPPVAKYSVGTIYGDQSLNLKTMTLANYVAGASATQSQMTLAMSIYTNRTALGPQAVSRTINIGFNTDASGNILSCVALSKMTDGIWQRSTLNINNIFYSPPSGGNVGIATAAPAVKLDVNGEVKAANTGIACAAAIAGAMRYNSTSTRMEYCDGNAWKSLGGVGQCTVHSAVIGAGLTTVNCPADETMTGGGIQCTGVAAMASDSYPSGNGWAAGPCYTVDAQVLSGSFSYVASIQTTAHGGTVWVRCCK